MKGNPENVIERAREDEVPVSNLILDPENTRLRHLKSGMEQSEIENYFWAESTTKELYSQIKAARGLYQPLIIMQNCIVKEGNRRLVCLRRLMREAHAGEITDMPMTQFDKAKCSILPTDATDREISMLLVSIHVRGKKTWDAFNKAEMFFHIHEDLKISYDSMSAELGIAKVTLIRIINAYKATKKYGEKFQDEINWHRNYIYFDELYRRRSLKSWRDNPNNVLQFFLWIHEGKLSDHNQVRRLDRILENERSSKIFDERGFEAAMDFLNSTDPTIQDSDFRKISQTIKTLQLFDRKALIKIVGDPARIRMLQNLRNETISLLHDIEALGKIAKEDV